MLQWTLADSYKDSTYVHYSSSNQFITSPKLDALFPGRIWPGINSHTLPAV